MTTKPLSILSNRFFAVFVLMSPAPALLAEEQDTGHRTQMHGEPYAETAANTVGLVEDSITSTASDELIIPDDATEDTIYKLEDFVVSGILRTNRDISVVPQTLNFIPKEALDDQLIISSDLISAISNEVPNYSPSRQKITGFGEKLRGRDPLFLIDGVPQSNPLRDGSRDGYTIDPIAVEGIEILNGPSAIQGVGATGGIINYNLYKAPEEDGYEGYLETRLQSSDEFSGATFGYRQGVRLGYREGKLGIVTAAAYQWNPMLLDGDGDFIGIDNTQGDTLNSEQYNIFVSLEYNPTESQTIRAFVNRFSLEQDLEYIAIPGDQSAGIPTTSTNGNPEGDPAHNDVWTTSLSYKHEDLLQGTFAIDFFYQNFAATFGGGTFGVFVNNGLPTFDQSENQSEKYGSRLTYGRSFESLNGLHLTGGLDYINDQTQQELIQTGRLWVPETDYESWAPFLQIDYALGILNLSGGFRREHATLRADDYETLEFYGPQTVGGGNPDFQELLFNVGATLAVNDAWTLYGSYAQGFGMPDVGRVLRGVNTPNQSVDTLIDLEPIVADNYEIGVRYDTQKWSHQLAVFFSTSDLGSRLVDNGQGAFEVSREKTQIYGVELSSDWQATEKDLFTLRFGLTEGKSDTDGDGDLDERLDGANIPPARINLAWARSWTDQIRSRLQASSFIDRDDPGDRENFDFDGYTTLDALVSYQLTNNWGQINLGVENLLDKQYITYFSQAATDLDDRYFAGRGRTLSLSYNKAF